MFLRFIKGFFKDRRLQKELDQEIKFLQERSGIVIDDSEGETDPFEIAKRSKLKFKTYEEFLEFRDNR